METTAIKEDFGILIDYCCTTAEELLLVHNAFHPFGVFFDVNDKMTPVSFYDNREQLVDQQLIDAAVRKFENTMAERKTRAYAVAFDAVISNEDFPDPTSAIAIKIIHSGMDDKYVYYYPYKLQDKQVEFLKSWGERL